MKSLEYKISSYLCMIPWPWLFLSTDYMWHAVGVQILALVAMYVLGERDYKRNLHKSKTLDQIFLETKEFDEIMKEARRQWINSIAKNGFQVPTRPDPTLWSRIKRFFGRIKP